MELVVEQVEEVASSQKRARESDVVGDVHLCSGRLEDTVAPVSKKLCIEEAVLSSIPNVLELEDLELQGDENNACSDESSVLNISNGGVGCVSGNEPGEQDLLAGHDVHSLFHAQYPAGSECSTLSKEDAARVLRSLEEELGVSSECDDYDSSSSSMPSLAAEEALVDAALSSWGEEIWDSSGFVVTAGGDASVTAGCSSGSSLTADDNESAATPICQGVDKLCALSTFEPVDGAQVDIGFLNEASDDELGIPPSPSSERVLDDGTIKEVCEESMSVLTEAGSLLGDHSADENGAAGPQKAQLHEAVSWALQDNSAEYPGFHDMAVEEEDWLMPVGSLDFLLDFSTGYVPVAT